MPPSAPQRPGDGRSKPPWVSFLPEVLKVRDQIDDPPAHHVGVGDLAQRFGPSPLVFGVFCR